MFYRANFLFLFLWLAPAKSSPLIQPLDLNWAKKEKSVPELKNFKYWYGDSNWGKIVYLGTLDMDGFETELHLEYSQSRILISANLILGPAGLRNSNCTSRYKQLITALNKKYGHFKFQKETKDPIAYDLVYDQFCNIIGGGMNEIVTVWQISKFKIELWLFGSEGDIFIEVGYFYNGGKNKMKFRNLLHKLL
jgi:hypothetical protein